LTYSSARKHHNIIVVFFFNMLAYSLTSLF
jgi:hypothetical protein